MEAARRRIPGAAAADLFSSSLYSLSLPISRFCVLLGWGAPTREVYALDFPRARFPPPFFPRAQPILRPCSVRLDESDAKATTRAREATP